MPRLAPLALAVLAALFATGSLIAPAPASAGLTPPGSNGVQKDIGFTIVPPWKRGEFHPMTCGYNCFKHKNNPNGSRDYFAMDFPMAQGTAIQAIAPGRVILAERLGSGVAAGTGYEPYGKSVMIEHVNGYQSFYAHLHTIQVSVGEEVDVDTTIGTAGQTGSGANSDHLHFAVYKGAVVGGTIGNRGPFGGSSVVPEPFSSCTRTTTGDCESIAYNHTLRRDDFAPEALVHPDGSLDLFTCGRSQNNLLQRHRSAAGSWGAWRDLGGTCASAPTAARDASGRVYVFVRGLDSQIYQRRRDTTTGAWANWSGLGLDIIGRPAAALDTVSGVLRVFARRASDDALAVASQSGLGFTGWSRLGGVLVASPVAGTRGDGRVDAYAVGTNYQLYKMPAVAGGGFALENWHPQSVSLEGDPHLITEGSLEWLVRSTGDRLLSAGANIAAATHPPAGARKPDGRLHTFVRNRANSALDYSYQTGFGWGASSFGGHVTSELEAVRAGSLGRVIVFTWGTGGLYSREQSTTNGTTSWGPWDDLHVPN